MRPTAAILLAAAAGAALGCTRMTSFDLPLMLASGERLLASGEFPRTNPFHWPHPGHPWLDDKWGFGLVCALAHRAGGAAALTALNAALGAVAGALLCVLAARRNAPAVAAGLAVAGVTMLSYRAMLRAEWISALGAAWTLLLLPGVERGSRRDGALLVAAVPLWAACHVYWILGPVLALAHAAGARSLRTAGWAAAAFAAGAVSPYGTENLLHPFRIAAGASAFEGAITELRLPFDGPTTYFHLLAAVLAIATAVWIVRGFRAGARGSAAACALLGLVALRYDRNLALLGVAFVGAAPELVSATAVRVAVAAGAAVVPAAGGLLAGVAWLAPERRPGFGWDESAFPLRLVASLPPETARERYVNDFSVGSFLDWARGSSFIDGNTHGYPPEHFAWYRRALEGSVTVAEVDARFPNDGWFLRTSAPQARAAVVGLFLEGDYAPEFWDDVATLFRPVRDPERADDLWRRWLAERYLAQARAWFPDPAEIAGPGGSLPPPGDAAARLALVVACPWHRPFVDGLRESYDAAGDPLRAARMWRLARRLPDAGP